MRRIRSLIGRHKLASGIGAFVLTGLVMFGFFWFRPDKLFVNKDVNEAAPPLAGTAAPRPSVPPTETVDPTVGKGTFRSLEHPTSGTARILLLNDGSLVLRLENFKTSNGPDVRVYLSQVPSDRGQGAYGDGFVDLGALKGNRGNQNYVIPKTTELDKYRSVVIWCRRFKVGFGVAPIGPA